MSTCAC